MENLKMKALGRRNKIKFVSKKDRNNKTKNISKPNNPEKEKRISEMNEKELASTLNTEYTQQVSMTEEELATIKKSYLEKKKKRKSNFKTFNKSSKPILNFDWSAKDDTSYDPNPLYQASNNLNQEKQDYLKVFDTKMEVREANQ